MESDKKTVILDRIPFQLDASAILKQMHLHADAQRFEKEIKDLIDIVTPLARPKAVYRVCCIENRTSDSLEIEGQVFNGKLMVDTLGKVDTVFVCVGTCGTEVESLQIPADQVERRYCFDAVKIALLFSAVGFLREKLQEKFQIKNISSLNPGELKAFPSTEHRKLFAILGDVEGMVGVKLTDMCALVPTKSHSGIYFSTETNFISCRMCTMKRCPGRRAPYSEELAEQYR